MYSPILLGTPVRNPFHTMESFRTPKLAWYSSLTTPTTGDSQVADDLLEIILRRKDVLRALDESPHRRSRLQSRLDFSKTTCHRIIRTLEDHGIVDRSDEGYILTELGRTLTEEVHTFERNVKIATRLEPLLDSFAESAVDLPVEFFQDAQITRPQPEDPSPPINRHLELYRQSESVRTLERTSFVPPLYIEEIFEEGFEKEGPGIAIYPKSVVESRVSKFPNLHQKIAEDDLPIRYRIHESIPFGLTVFDDTHVGLRAYDDETGTLRLFVDTDDPKAVTWAIDVFEQYYEESDPVSAFDDLPDWLPSSEVSFEAR